ncbi:splicing regulatory glutamine/lysine-rich protein 1 [Brassica napus]|uniref:Uncharacterized protein n=1 Tax=Brassica campestris TaxID=3711 RepID=M4FHC4_BRACM|nr:splicing regulatory glutamine/lysine-rich protein 1 [Brassica napus]CAF2375300.1 unnamed protein product [Brassica napus]
MAKISIVLLVVALIVFLHVSEAQRSTDKDEQKDKEEKVTENDKDKERNKDEKVDKDKVKDKDKERDKDENVLENDKDKDKDKERDKEEKVIEKDLDEAKDLIAEDLKEKKANLKSLETQVNELTKSETVLDELGEAHKKGKSLKPYEKKLKKFNRRIKRTPKKKRYGSIIQSILKDLGLNRGRY